MHRIILLLAIWFGALLVGCSLLPDLPDLGESELPATVTATPETAVTPQSTIEFTQPLSSTVTPTPPSAPTLRIWLPPDIAQRTDVGAGILVSQLQTFNNRYPELEMIVEQKIASGQGGIISYLRTGREVAPSILPDLIALPSELLRDAAEQEAIVPLDDLLAPQLFDALYPAAARMSMINDRRIGYPFALTNLTHLAYNRSVITQTVPLQWSEFVTDTRNTVVFSAAGRQSAFLGLEFYAASSGRLVNEAGQPDLQLDPLTNALEQLSLGRATLASSLPIDTPDKAWQLYTADGASAVWVTSDYYLSLATAEGSDGFAAVPGPNGPITPHVSGWVWLITTQDPAKRLLVAELLSFLVEPQNLAQWSSASNILPARRDALALWERNSDYRAFLTGELESAQVLPVGPNSRLIEALGNATMEVLSTAVSPQVIAEEAIETLRQ